MRTRTMADRTRVVRGEGGTIAGLLRSGWKIEEDTQKA